jgi:hypothetical protein
METEAMPSKKKSSAAKRSVIAERQLVDEHGHKIEVTMEMPERVSDIEWRCGFRIVPDGSLRFGRGNDSFQALANALELIRVALDQLESPAKWEGGETYGDTGFTRLVPLYPGFAFRKKLEAMIESEIREFSEGIITGKYQRPPRDDKKR